MYNNFSSKKTKKVISALLASALVVTSAPITANAATKKVVGVGKTVTYKAGATVKKITVKNKKVVKATKSKKNKKNVVLKGLKAGKTTVTIKTSKKTIKLNVCVGATKITKKTLKTTMTAGGKQTVSVTAAGGKGDTITFTSSKKSVLKVNKASAKASKKGIAKMSVAAVAEGTAKLTVASKNTGVKKAFTIKVVAATPAPATQPPTVATTPAVTGTATAVATTPAVQATATAAVPGATDATATPGTDVTATPGTDVTSTPGADVTATPGADVTAAPSFDPVTAKEGTLTVNANVSGASIRVISGGSTVATVTMDVLNNSVTTSTLAPGEYEIEVSKKGYDTYKGKVVIDGNQTLNVTLAEEVKLGASAVVQNQLIGYDDIVLVNDNAIVTVTVKDKNGNLVPNKTVVFSTSHIAGTAEYEVKGQNVQVTDANGRASFVVGIKDSANVKATSTDKVGSVEYTARVLDVTDGTNSVATGCVGFAALKLGEVSIDKDTKDLKNKILEPGKNADGAGFKRGKTVRDTHSLYYTDDVNYVNAQQVSAKGGEERAITFDVAPKINLPAMKTTNEVAKDFVQPVNVQSGKYSTYADDQYDKVITLDEDASKLQYATLVFNSIQLSNYTKMTIESFYDVKCEEKVPNSKKELEGELEQTNFGYQIPLTTGSKTVKAIKVSLKSAGQVQTNKNSGYDIKEIRGIYNSANGVTSGGDQEIATATVSWEAVQPMMSELQYLSTEDAVNVYGITPADQKTAAETKSTFKYTVPVYPYTGNAVIREYDANGKIVSYYLTPTVKSTEAGTENTNVLVSLKDTGLKAYKATEEEASAYITTGLKTAGNRVTVNSEKVGSTTLKGTINLPGIGNEVLDAASRNVYTSVQWNPIPDKKVSTSNAFLALAGQKITVYAQLTDKNGNPVSLPNQSISYTYNKITSDKTAAVGTLVSKQDVENINEIAVVKNTETDVNGVATLVLSAAEATVLDNLKATCGDASYDVTLEIGGEVASSADLYWVNANLAFTNSVLNGAKTFTTENGTENAEASKPTVSTPWEYAVKTVGNTFIDNHQYYTTASGTAVQYAGDLEDYSITIDGLKINVSSDDDNKGTYKVGTNGVITATSEHAHDDMIATYLDDTSVGSDITFTAKKGTDTLTFKCVGEGSANLNARLKLTIPWVTDGTQVSMITPKGTNIARKIGNSSVNAYTVLYAKLTDKTGKNPIADTDVTFKSGNTNDKFYAVTDTGAKGLAIADGTVKTDNNGIAKIILEKDTDVKVTSSVVTASVENVENVASTTINWVNEKNTNTFGVLSAAMKKDDVDPSKTSKNEVEVLFTNDITTSSVRPELFELTRYDDSAKKTVTYEVSAAKANGKRVVLTSKEDLPAGEYKVTVKKYKENSVIYELADEAGKILGYDSDGDGIQSDDVLGGTDYEFNTVSFYSTKNAKFEVSQKVVSGSDNKKTEITVTNINTPVEVDPALSSTGDTTFDKHDIKLYFAKYANVVVGGEVQKLVPDAMGGSLAGATAATSDTIGKLQPSNIDVYVDDKTLTDGKITEDTKVTFVVDTTKEDQKVSVSLFGRTESTTPIKKDVDAPKLTGYKVDTTAATVTLEFDEIIADNTANVADLTAGGLKGAVKVTKKDGTALTLKSGNEVTATGKTLVLTFTDNATNFIDDGGKIVVDARAIADTLGNAAEKGTEYTIDKVDKTAPTVAVTSATYDKTTNKLVLTGTGFETTGTVDLSKVKIGTQNIEAIAGSTYKIDSNTQITITLGSDAETDTQIEGSGGAFENAGNATGALTAEAGYFVDEHGNATAATVSATNVTVSAS